jgi:hypothetical protein
MTTQHEQRVEDRKQIQAASDTLTTATEKTESLNETTLKILKIIGFFMFIEFVIMIGLAILVQRNNWNNEETSKAVQTVKVQVQHLDTFVTDLEQDVVTPEEQAQQDAVVRAVQIVPIILQVVCEANPTVPSCQP